MVETAVVELTHRLPEMAMILRALERQPLVFLWLQRIYGLAQHCLAQKSAFRLRHDHSLLQDLARIPGLGVCPPAMNLGPAEWEGQFRRLARTCRARMDLEGLVREFRRRLGAGKELKGRVLTESAEMVEELARECRAAPTAIYAISRATWGEDSVVLTDLDLAFHSRRLVRFFSSKPRRVEEDEYVEDEAERTAVPPPEQVVLFAATIGGDLEERAREEMAGGSPFGALVADALGSALAEGAARDLMDYLEKIRLLGPEGTQGMLRRFHPGYSDWPLEDQRLLFGALEPDRIGLSLGPSCLMIPEKSVAGLAGVKKGRPTIKRVEKGER